MTSKERRRALRAPAKLAMEIRLSGDDYAHVESINVSANGVYFSSPHFIAPMTRLEITLLVPDKQTSRPGKQQVTCVGVVVRSEPEQPEPAQKSYEIACYFTSISAPDKERLETYILNQLAF